MQRETQTCLLWLNFVGPPDHRCCRYRRIPNSSVQKLGRPRGAVLLSSSAHVGRLRPRVAESVASAQPVRLPAPISQNALATCAQGTCGFCEWATQLNSSLIRPNLRQRDERRNPAES